MKLKEAREIIQAGLLWANWTEEQRAAMIIALDKMADDNEVKAALKEEYQYWEQTIERDMRMVPITHSDSNFERYHFGRGFVSAMDKMRRLEE